MKSRRRIAHPKAQDYADFQSGITAGICAQRNGVGSVYTAAILSRSCPLCAKSGLMHRSKMHLYSITSSASDSRLSEITDCCARAVSGHGFR
jgi:hypothetical protein